MLPKSEILKYGGKGAILNHVKDNLPEISIPEYLIINPYNAESLDGLFSKTSKLKSPLIVRSSSPFEYGDFEGIFASIKNVTYEDSLNLAVEKVKESTMSERAQKYAKQNGFKISDDIRIIVQEQSDLPNGAMMRHPNNPDLIFITTYRDYKTSRFSREYSSFLFDEETQKEKKILPFPSYGFEEKDARFLVEKYKQIESLKDIAKGYSLFVEFGFNPVVNKPFELYQVRPFKKIKTADFELPNVSYDDGHVLKTDLVFGTTPKKGIVFPLVRSFGVTETVNLTNRLWERDNIEFNGYDGILLMHLENARHTFESDSIKKHIPSILMNWNLELNNALKGKPYCFMTSSAHREEYDVDLSVHDMKGLISGSGENFLVHDLIRLIKKADIALFDYNLPLKRFFKQATSLEDNVRIISNGKEAIAIKE